MVPKKVQALVPKLVYGVICMIQLMQNLLLIRLFFRQQQPFTRATYLYSQHTRSLCEMAWVTHMVKIPASYVCCYQPASSLFVVVALDREQVISALSESKRAVSISKSRSDALGPELTEPFRPPQTTLTHTDI